MTVLKVIKDVKKQSREQKKADKETAIKNPRIKCINFDLQKVLISPRGNVSDYYYSRTLATYNLTTYDMAFRKAVCYMWDETQAKRGSAEISMCLYKFNSSVGAIDEMIYYSDSCTGQQRNAGFSMMCLYSVNTLLIKRNTHNYFERGHSML